MTIQQNKDKTDRPEFQPTQRVRISNADSEGLIQKLLDLNQKAISISTMADNRFIRVNQSWCEMTGCRPEEVIGKTPQELDIGLDSKHQSEMTQTIGQQGHTENLKTRYLTKDGRKILVQLSAEIISYQGEMCFMTNTTLVDEPAVPQKALHAEQQGIFKILTSLKMAYYETDLKGNVTFFNDTLLDSVYGRTKEELLNMNFKEYTLLEDVPKVHDAYHELYNGNCTVKCIEHGVVRKDGTLSYVELSISLMKDDIGRAIGFYGIARDRTEQRKAEEALRNSEERRLGILDEMEEGYYETDLMGNFVYANSAHLKSFGINPEEMVGMNANDFLSPERQNLVTELFTETYQTGKPVRIADHELIRSDGTILYVDMSGYALKDENGKIVGFWGITRDRTEQRKAELALRRSEEKYRNILESMNEGYYEFDLKGNFSDFNDATLQLHGRSADELRHMSYKQYTPTEQHEKVIQDYTKMYQTGTPIKLYNHEIIRKDGRIRHIEVSAYLRKNEYGETVGCWGITRDRTEQKLAEIALKESEEQYRLLVENAGDAIYITQEDTIKYHNPKMMEITGYNSEALTRIAFADLIHSEDKKFISTTQQRLIETGQGPGVVLFRMINLKKEILWVELNAIGITWEEKPAILNFLRDVTQIKKTESMLQQAQKMEAMGTLAGGIAHDFNNILAAIIGFADLALDDSPQGSQLEENLNDIMVAGNRAKDLVRQILAFARQSEEKVDPVMVSIIAKEALKLIRSAIPSTIDIQTKIESNSRIMGNSTQVHQIIMNLCTNAAHAMEDMGGVLKVHLADTNINEEQAKRHINLEPGNYLNLTVADTGRGIAPEILNSIFEPYFTTKGLGEGTGMGLSVVQGIVESYNGEITVQSELGKGTTFSILLPTTAGRCESKQQLTDAVSPGNSRILFVDDEEMITKMASRTLQRQGYEVIVLNSSLKALELFKSRPADFDLIIIDVTMPKMTGDQLARELFRIRPDISIVICTGYSKKINEKQAKEMGIKAFVHKPIDRSELVSIIRRVLNKN